MLAVSCLVQAASAQSWQSFQSAYSPPVSWHYHAEKTDDGSYQLHLKAMIKPGWHLYAQKQPEDAIAIPTKIKFRTTTLVDFVGTPREVGKKQTATIASMGISAYQYTGEVDFIQQIKLTGSTPDFISGSITYQVCKEYECLPPKTVDFNIRLKE